jgi:methylenetetrahydrofolate dehydrogenase (NADP+)/methenyltetrahydrofolate cyclohydrolase
MVAESQARLLDGKTLAATVAERLKPRVEALRCTGVTPCLATVLVGDDAASESYVRGKRRRAAKLGIESSHHHLPAQTTTDEIVRLVRRLDADSSVHGILVQLPLPPQVDERTVLAAFSPAKDVDGFHPMNIGALATKGVEPLFVPATPKGILRLLRENGIQVAGREAVVVGRSKIVGTPMALLLVKNDATVTLCHSRTRDLADVTRRADILIVATGVPKMIGQEMVRPGAVVVDVGISRVEGKLVGDVDFEKVSRIADAITPVPGGVGPMTVIMLMENVVVAAERSAGQRVALRQEDVRWG